MNKKSLFAIFLVVVFLFLSSGFSQLAGAAFWNSSKSTPSKSATPRISVTPRVTSTPSKTPIPTSTTAKTGVYCDFSGNITPNNQGLLDYTAWSSNAGTVEPESLDMTRRMSIVNKTLASKYVILNNIGSNVLTEAVFSMLEYYKCMIPDWLYAKLDGVYLAKYLNNDTFRASVIVFEDRATAEYVAQLLMSLSTDELQTKTVNGNFVYYTAQKAYWWSHENLLIRLSGHTTPVKVDKNGNATQGDLNDTLPCEALDPLGEMREQCVWDQFWKEVPIEMLNAYLTKLPSDAEDIPWPTQGQFANAGWPSNDTWEQKQMGCDDKAKEVWEEVGNPWEEEHGLEMRQGQNVKITHLTTDKRFYYLGNKVTILATAYSVDGNFGNVYADVNNNIYPSVATTRVTLNKMSCSDRVPYTQKITGAVTDFLRIIANNKISLSITEAKMDELKKSRTQAMETIRENRELMLKKIETYRENLKEELAKLKDQNRARIVVGVDEKIADLNQRMVDHYTNVVDQLENVLERINKRAQDDADDGLDISSVTTAISKATDAIKKAREAIEEQSQKIYEINITTDAKLKADVGETRQALQNDLKKVRDVIITAKVAVHDSAIALGKIHGITPRPTVSPTVTVTPTVTPTPSN